MSGTLVFAGGTTPVRNRKPLAAATAHETTGTVVLPGCIGALVHPGRPAEQDPFALRTSDPDVDWLSALARWVVLTLAVSTEVSRKRPTIQCRTVGTARRLVSWAGSSGNAKGSTGERPQGPTGATTNESSSKCEPMKCELDERTGGILGSPEAGWQTPGTGFAARDRDSRPCQVRTDEEKGGASTGSPFWL
jgi:hypothetical protein